MRNDEIDRRIHELLQLVLGGKIAAGDVSREAEPRWDSIKNIEFAFLLEDEFGVQFNEDDLAEFVSLSAIARVVEVRLAA